MISVNTAFNGYIGLSTDTKPAALNGSRFYEMDTQKSYMYDQEGAEWIEQTAEGGGGGGESAGKFKITATVTYNSQSGTYSATVDKTHEEIMAAIDEGKDAYVELLDESQEGLVKNLPLAVYYTEDGNSYAHFASVYAQNDEDGDRVFYVYVGVYASDVIYNASNFSA